MENNQSKPQTTLSPQEKQLFSQFAINLSMAFVQAQMLGIEHQFTRQPAERALGFLKNILQLKGDAIFYVAEGKFKYELFPLEEKNLLVQKLVVMFSKANLVSIRFRSNLQEKDFFGLLGIFARKVDEILSSGGVEKLAAAAQMQTVEVNPVKYELIGKTQKIVNENVQVFDLDAAPVQTEKEVDKDQAVLNLIHDALKPETNVETFVQRLKENPAEVAGSISEALHLLDKVEKAKGEEFFSSLYDKLSFIKEDLFRVLVENKTYEMFDEVSLMSKDLTQQLRVLNISESLQDMFAKVRLMNEDIGDRLACYTLFLGVTVENISPRQKAKIAKALLQKKVTQKFELLCREVLRQRGFNPEQIQSIFEEGLKLAQEKKAEKEFQVPKEANALLEKVKSQEIPVDQASDEMKKVFEELVLKQEKARTKKLKEQNMFLTSYSRQAETVFDILKYGIVLLDPHGKVLFVNKHAEQFGVFRKEDFLSESFLAQLKTWSLQKDGSVFSPEFQQVAAQFQQVITDDTGNVVGIILNLQ